MRDLFLGKRGILAGLTTGVMLALLLLLLGYVEWMPYVVLLGSAR